MDATITVASQSMPTWAQPTFIACVIFFIAGVILALTTKRGVSAGITIMILSALALAYTIMKVVLSMEAANEMAIAREAEAATGLSEFSYTRNYNDDGKEFQAVKDGAFVEGVVRDLEGDKWGVDIYDNDEVRIEDN